VPNRSVDMDSWDRSACYPRGTFYPLSDGPSTWDRRITRPCFRTCSTCRSRSQAPLCPCTRQLIADQLEGTFGRLRYSLGSLLARQLVMDTVAVSGSFLPRSARRRAGQTIPSSDLSVGALVVVVGVGQDLAQPADFPHRSDFHCPRPKSNNEG
jgi:hypothetical protein